MAALDDLNAAVTAIQTAVTTAIADIQALQAQVTTLQASNGATPAQLESIVAQLQSTTSTLTAALPAPAAPAMKAHAMPHAVNLGGILQWLQWLEQLGAVLGPVLGSLPAPPTGTTTVSGS